MFPAMKCTDYRLQTKGKSTIIVVFYHLDCINFLHFIDSFTTYMEINILEKTDFILLGDFNIPVNILDYPKASTFRDF